MTRTDKTTDRHAAPLNSCVVPRPIGWISTTSKDSVVNLAPFSYFNLVSSEPPIVAFSAATRPDGVEKRHSTQR